MFKSPDAVSHSSFFATTERKPSACSHNIMNEGFLQCSIIVQHTGAAVGLDEPVGLLLYLQNYVKLISYFKNKAAVNNGELN